MIFLFSCFSFSPPLFDDRQEREENEERMSRCEGGENEEM